MEKIVFLDRDTMWANMDLQRPDFPHQWIEYGKTTPEQVAERIGDADIAIINKSPITQDVLDQCPNLKMITIIATGFNVVDIEACTNRGVSVCNARGYAVNTVPELVMSMILALKKSLFSYAQDVADGKWQNAGQFCFLTHPVQDLAGLNMGIFGSGSLGGSVARLTEAFGMNVMYAEHKGQDTVRDGYTHFDHVIANADVISVHTPLTPQTQNMIALPEFEKMQKSPILINAGRGGLVNETDIVTALDKGYISGIGFDVLTTEPPNSDNPLLSIANRPNVLITPHVAWGSTQACATLWQQTIENLNQYIKGQAVRVLNDEV